MCVIEGEREREGGRVYVCYIYREREGGRVCVL